MKYLKAFFKRVYELMVKYPLAVAAAVFLIVGAAIMAIFGHEVQIGGLLQQLFGKKPQPDIRVIPPPGRVDKSGNQIALGDSDDRGFVQVPVTTKIKEPGIFSNPDTITVVHPEKGEVTIPLPVGVKNKDVSEVIEVEPGVYQIKNNDSGVDTGELRDILK